MTQTKVSDLGARAVRNPSFVARLRDGASPRLATVELVYAWMAAHTSETEAHAIQAAVNGGRRGSQSGGRAIPAPGGKGSGRPLPILPDRFERAPGKESTIPGDMNMGDSNVQDEVYMTTREAAAIVGLSPRTLDRYRVTGTGPAFHRLGGRVRYRRTDVDAWAAERRQVSTSGGGTGGRRARS